MDKARTIDSVAKVPREGGVVELRRPILSILWKLVSDPLASIPPEPSRSGWSSHGPSGRHGSMSPIQR